MNLMLGLVTSTNAIASPLASLELDPGYWRISLDSPVATRCNEDLENDASTCTGGGGSSINGSVGYCKPGHYGPLCALCLSDGYYVSSSEPYEQECRPCSNGLPPEPSLLAKLLVRALSTKPCR